MPRCRTVPKRYDRASCIVRRRRAAGPELHVAAPAGAVPPAGTPAAFTTCSERRPSMPEPVEIFRFGLVGVYIGALVAVAAYGFHRYVLVYLYLKHRDETYQPKARFPKDQLPRVTVQLPMFNEDTVAERVIRAACR